ncbi:46 kDa FK506-binding nuclear protein [Helicoverpa zea]|uniref:46 kDa FK506-binding nuclear protein n=1 Tax=Helicoverpa zea TaxID=7113 RepID=UPI001F57D27E|nr:46 kDa FK506-binding nuclear protein [Helicoverpa zea]
MFWGLIMEPNKRYTQVVEKPFHISQAAMDISTGDNDPCQVMVVVDGKNFLVCTLQKGKNIQVLLDLYFKTGDSISFLTNGKCNVHLTGYLDPEFEDDLEEEEEEDEDEEEEAPTLVPAKNKRKLENANDTAANKKAKVPEKKAGKKAPAAESDSDDDDDDEDQLQKFLDGEDIDTDENDDSFKVNTSAEGDDSDEDDDDDDEEEEDDDDDDDEEEEESPKKKKKKGAASEQDSTLDTSKEDVDMSKLSKSQKRRLKKKLQQQAKQQPQVNGVDKAKKEEPQQKAEKKKPEAKKEAQESAEKKEKKQIAGGVSIEDLKVGSGPVAKAGKVVMVYYEGRLKQNNKMFDNCVKGPGFKFRLGSKEVISGWDAGIAGMKVGGKRRIVCPPAMAYGAKGSPPVIPPNSTLVFEVELKNVK